MIERFVESPWALPIILAIAVLSESIVEWLSSAIEFVINWF